MLNWCQENYYTIWISKFKTTHFLIPIAYDYVEIFLCLIPTESTYHAKAFIASLYQYGLKYYQPK